MRTNFLKKTIGKYIGTKYKNTCLLVAIVSLILLFPFFEGGAIRPALLNLLSSFVLIIALYDVGYSNNRSFVFALLVGVPAILSNWIAITMGTPFFQFASVVISIPFYFFITISLLLSVLKAKKISGEEIAGSISVYLLIGITWGYLYLLVSILIPGAFYSSTLAEGGRLYAGDLLYYSFVTLTTVGYGDIVPVATLARSLAVLEAVLGVLFIAVLISRLISLYEGGDNKLS